MSDRDKSWREIDRQKDKSSHVDRDDDKTSRRDGGASSSYKRKLDRVFESGGQVPEEFEGMMETIEPEEGTPEAEYKEAVDALRDAEEEGFRAFVTAVNDFREEGHTMPDDEELLIRMLDHPDERVARDVLEHYLDLADRRELQRTGPLENRLSTIETMSDHPETRRLVDEVKELL